jgi:hypothetical protein
VLAQKLGLLQQRVDELSAEVAAREAEPERERRFERVP